MKILFLITARAGSKGLPGKNTKLFCGKPLVQYSIDFAQAHMKQNDMLCVSTNDQEIIKICEDQGIQVPFVRPASLASDTANSYDVIIHAINFYEQLNIVFDAVLLLQPTSPLRTQDDFNHVISSFNDDTEMVVSVKKSKDNPYFNLFEEGFSGYLEKSKQGNFQRRQDCPDVFAYNGSLYLMRVDALKKSPMHQFTKIKKVVMPDERSIDIDTMADWILAEFYFNKQ